MEDTRPIKLVKKENIKKRLDTIKFSLRCINHHHKENGFLLIRFTPHKFLFKTDAYGLGTGQAFLEYLTQKNTLSKFKR